MFHITAAPESSKAFGLLKAKASREESRFGLFRSHPGSRCREQILNFTSRDIPTLIIGVSHVAARSCCGRVSSRAPGAGLLAYLRGFSMPRSPRATLGRHCHRRRWPRPSPPALRSSLGGGSGPGPPAGQRRIRRLSTTSSRKLAWGATSLSRPAWSTRSRKSTLRL